jgi:hypothetical protein
MEYDEAARLRQQFFEKQKRYEEEQRRRKESRKSGKVCASCGTDLTYQTAYRAQRYGDEPFVMLCEKCAPDWLTSFAGKPSRIVQPVHVHWWHCAGCGRDVVFGMSAGQYRERVYCSDDCRAAYRRKRKESQPHTNTCEVCAKEFTSKRSDAKTCSSACRQKAYRQRSFAESSGETNDG